VNGEHAHRLERIEKRVDELHDKMDELAETEAANATDIVWLKWTMRGPCGGRGDAEHMHDVLPWSHTVFSNLKRVLVIYGVHAYVEDGNVQPDLDAFTFRFNHYPFTGKALDKALNGIVEMPPRPNERLQRSGQLHVVA
jgi:hypothetical protein